MLGLFIKFRPELLIDLIELPIQILLKDASQPICHMGQVAVCLLIQLKHRSPILGSHCLAVVPLHLKIQELDQ